MSSMIIRRISITSDHRVLVERATNNIRPLYLRYNEIESLTELLRTEGRQMLDMEILSLFFKELWRGKNRYTRAIGYALVTAQLDKYEAWERCRQDKDYERRLLMRLHGFLDYRPVPYSCHLEYQGRPVRRISTKRISFSQQQRRIFRSILDAQAALVWKGWNPEHFRVVAEENVYT